MIRPPKVINDHVKDVKAPDIDVRKSRLQARTDSVINHDEVNETSRPGIREWCFWKVLQQDVQSILE